MLLSRYVIILDNVVMATDPSPYPCSRTMNTHDPWIRVCCIGLRA